jgi:iron(III) transport system substrate-binding protein
LNGLQGDARQQKLIELAKAAGGKATVYSADIEAVLTPLKAQFEKDTGISLETTRLTSVDILARISQEAQANHVAADAVLITDSDSYAADSLKLFEPLQTPVSADLLPGSMHGGWAAATATPFVAAWNTNNVKGADIPTDWKQVYENFQGRLGFEITDYTFFGGLVQYFMKTYNMTEDQAVQYFVDHAKGARVVSGHNTLMNLLNTGEFDMTAGQFSSVVDAAKANGAPGDWKPPVKPLFQINAGVGVLNNAPNCAAGLLYVEYRLQQGQKIAFDASKLAGTNPKYAPSVASNAGISDSDVVVIPKDILFDNRAHWKEQYQKVIDAAGH